MTAPEHAAASVQRITEFLGGFREFLGLLFEVGSIGVEYEQIEIRNQRTKWGNCSTTGTLGLNWRLMMASPEVVDYILVHELAHLRESNHDDAF